MGCIEEMRRISSGGTQPDGVETEKGYLLYFSCCALLRRKKVVMLPDPRTCRKWRRLEAASFHEHEPEPLYRIRGRIRADKSRPLPKQPDRDARSYYRKLGVRKF